MKNLKWGLVVFVLLTLINISVSVSATPVKIATISSPDVSWSETASHIKISNDLLSVSIDKLTGASTDFGVAADANLATEDKMVVERWNAPSSSWVPAGTYAYSEIADTNSDAVVVRSVYSGQANFNVLRILERGKGLKYAVKAKNVSGSGQQFRISWTLVNTPAITETIPHGKKFRDTVNTQKWLLMDWSDAYAQYGDAVFSETASPRAVKAVFDLGFVASGTSVVFDPTIISQTSATVGWTLGGRGKRNIAILDYNVYVGVIADTNYRYFQSTDGGATWASLTLNGIVVTTTGGSDIAVNEDYNLVALIDHNHDGIGAADVNLHFGDFDSVGGLTSRSNWKDFNLSSILPYGEQSTNGLTTVPYMCDGDYNSQGVYHIVCPGFLSTTILHAHCDDFTNDCGNVANWIRDSNIVLSNSTVQQDLSIYFTSDGNIYVGYSNGFSGVLSKAGVAKYNKKTGTWADTNVNTVAESTNNTFRFVNMDSNGDYDYVVVGYADGAADDNSRHKGWNGIGLSDYIDLNVATDMMTMAVDANGTVFAGVDSVVAGVYMRYPNGTLGTYYSSPAAVNAISLSRVSEVEDAVVMLYMDGNSPVNLYFDKIPANRLTGVNPLNPDTNKAALCPADNNTLATDTNFYGQACDVIDANGDGVIRIGANNITVDCNGMILRGSYSSTAIRNSGYDNVTIKNCQIESYDKGISFVVGADSGLIMDNKLALSNFAIISQTSFDTNIFSNDFNNNSKDGIYVDTNGANISDNNIVDTNVVGVYVTGAGDINVVDNNIWFNRARGIEIASIAHDVNVVDNNVSRNGTDGIVVNGGDRAIVRNNVVENNGGTANIYVLNSSDSNITNNTTFGDVRGVFLSTSERNLAQGNTTRGATYGVVVSGVGAGNAIVGNFSDVGNNYGMYVLTGTAGNLYRDNNISNASVIGIYFLNAGADNNVFRNNISYNGAGAANQGGIAISGTSSDINISDNNFFKNNGFGIQVSGNIPDIVVRDNNFSNNSIVGIRFLNNMSGGSSVLLNRFTFDLNAISVSNSKSIVIYDNNIADSNTGVRIEGATCGDFNILRNNISRANKFGIRIDDVNKGTITDNNISNNTGSGISFGGTAWDWNVFRNTLVANYRGLHAESIYDLNSADNNISYNTLTGIGLAVARDVNFLRDIVKSNTSEDMNLNDANAIFLDGNYGSIVFADINAKIDRRWYLDANVVSASNNLPLQDANVWLKKVNGVGVFSELSVVNGSITQKQITQFDENILGKTSYTPHTFVVLLSGFDTNNFASTIDGNKNLKIYLLPTISTISVILANFSCPNGTDICSESIRGDNGIIGADNTPQFSVKIVSSLYAPSHCDYNVLKNGAAVASLQNQQITANDSNVCVFDVNSDNVGPLSNLEIVQVKWNGFDINGTSSGVQNSAVYKFSEGEPPLPDYYCGDGICSAGEDATDCPEDCGEGGGAAGGGAGGPTEPEKPSLITSKLIEYKASDRIIYLAEKTERIYSLTIMSNSQLPIPIEAVLDAELSKYMSLTSDNFVLVPPNSEIKYVWKIYADQIVWAKIDGQVFLNINHGQEIYPVPLTLEKAKPLGVLAFFFNPICLPKPLPILGSCFPLYWIFIILFIIFVVYSIYYGKKRKKKESGRGL